MASLACLQSYGSASDTDSEEEEVKKIEPSDQPSGSGEYSLAKSMEICSNPAVIPVRDATVSRVVDPATKELEYNPKYDELFAPVKGPENPFLTDQMRATKNMLCGFVEKAHISAFQFENQRRTFHTFGYALDPSVDGVGCDGQSYVGDLQAAYDTDGKTVFEPPALPTSQSKRKRKKNDNPEDIGGFLGPWGKFEDEKTVAIPTEQEKAELEELLSKKHKRGKLLEEKPVEEKSVLHIKDAID